VPEALMKQLKVGGRLIVPIGPEGEQRLVRFTRREQRMERETLGAVAFVPLLGGIS
jgi:protein-L-isoaspartate(D-aspartate) O-methyltransferase